MIEEVDRDEHVSHGVERKGVESLDGDDRHILFSSGLAESGKAIAQLQKKPVWVKDGDVWMQSLLSRGLRTKPLICP